MLERGKGPVLIDSLVAVLPNSVVMAVINLVSLNHLVTLALALSSLAFLLWRWRRDSFVWCEGCRNGKIPSSCPIPMRRRPWWCPKKI